MNKMTTVFMTLLAYIISMGYPLGVVSPYQVSGTYPVSVTYLDDTGTEQEKIVYMTVLSPNTVVSTTTEEAIDAYDAYVEAGTMATITDASLVQITQAHAWRQADGVPVAITSITRTQYAANPVSYRVIFATAKGTTVTVHIIEQDKIALQSEETYLAFYNCSTIVERYFFLFLIMLLFIPLLLLIIIFFVSTTRVQQMKKLLYKK